MSVRWSNPAPVKPSIARYPCARPHLYIRGFGALYPPALSLTFIDSRFEIGPSGLVLMIPGGDHRNQMEQNQRY